MLRHPYAGLLGSVERPGRYVGGEFGAVTPDPGARVRTVLAFPDAYEIGMSHIGLAVLYEVVNTLDGFTAERVFMPWPDMEERLRERGLPLVSLESATPLRDFDVIGFSPQYELNSTNLIALLDLGGVPRRAADRIDGDPLVIAGGPLAAQCEPVAPFLDLVLVGDGEEALPEVLGVVARGAEEGWTRARTIATLAGMSCIFAPSLIPREIDARLGRLVATGGIRAAKATVRRLGDQAPGAGPVPSVNAVFDRYSVEIARGCAEGCRFCQAGFTYRPVRERDEAETSAAVDRAVGCLGYDEVSLAALSSADHTRIEQIVAGLGERLTPERVSLSVPSLRAYGLADELVEVVSRMRASGVTLAPEAGSQRLRDSINKNVTEADLLGAAARFFDHGFNRIKLYFMLGLPGETDDDLREILELADRLRTLGRRRMSRGPQPVIVVSVSTFVPKPFTPFEREGMIPIAEIRRRQALLAQLGRRHKLEVRLHDPRLSRLEGIFCRGDASLAEVLERAVDLGARFDGWGEMFKASAWDQALGGIDTDALTGPIPDDARLCWDHVDVGVTEVFRRRERDRARAFLTTRPCGRYGREPGQAPAFVCHACGVGCVAADLPVRSPRIARDPDPPMPVRERRSGRPRPDKLPARTALSGSTHVARVRLEIAYTGRQIFLGHLDRMKNLSRGLRRAGLVVEYTQGFHPKPKLEASPPLPLGTAGLAEIVDLWLVDPPDDGEIAARLVRSFPPEMELVTARRLDGGTQKLGKAIRAAEYVALIDAARAEAAEAVSGLLGAEALEVERTRKGMPVTFDARPYLLEAEVLDGPWGGPGGGTGAGRVAVRLVILVPPSGGARPIDLLRPVLGEAAEGAWLIRTKWLLDGD